MTDMSLFNVRDGYMEAVLRGMRSGFLTVDDYRRLAASESFTDLRTALEETEYGQFMQDEPLPLTPDIFKRKAKEKHAAEFEYLRANASESLLKFLDFVERETMINNCVTLLQGALSRTAPDELLANVDPLGMCEELAAIPTTDLSPAGGGFEELYKTILIDTPIGGYFAEALESLSEAATSDSKEISTVLSTTDLELLKQGMRKAWLEDFHQFVETECNGPTAESMGHVLKVTADFSVLLVTMNALNTGLSSQGRADERNALFPSIGYLYPEGADRVRKAWNMATVRAAIEPYGRYVQLFEAVKTFYEARDNEANATKISQRSLEDEWFAHQVELSELLFETQFQYGIFYAWSKLREQEIRNLGWIADMISLNRRDQIDEGVIPIFKPRY